MSEPAFSDIAAINGIASVIPIAPVPGVGAVGRRPPGAKFRVADLPTAVQQAFEKAEANRPDWPIVLKAAKTAGITDDALLADLIFFLHHPERLKDKIGRPIARNEDDFIRLSTDWGLYHGIARRFLDPSVKLDVFLPALNGRSYEDFVPPPTTGEIELMVHGRCLRPGPSLDRVDTFDKMQVAVEALTAGDSLFIAAWYFNPSKLPLTITRSGMAHWDDLLHAKAKEGVRIRIIVSRHPPLSKWETPTDLLDKLIEALPPAAQGNFKYIFSRHSIVGTHHQKLMVITRNGEVTAFLGGLDLSDLRTPDYWNENFVMHDVHARLRGAVARDCEREFVLRWNREQPSFSLSEELRQSPGPTGDGAFGDRPNLQILRTVSAQPGLVGEAIRFALVLRPADIRRADIWQAYMRLIGRAQRYIYIENQYLREPRLADALVTQAQAQPELIFILVVSTGTDDDTNMPLVARMNMLALRREFFRRFRVIPEERRRVFTVYPPSGLLHSKLIIVDDEFLSVGSANINPRGFFLDSEINVLVEDRDKVLDFRSRLWAHNLKVPEERIAKWPESSFFREWGKVAARNGRHEKSPAQMVGEGILKFDPWNILDPRFGWGYRTSFLHEVLF